MDRIALGQLLKKIREEKLDKSLKALGEVANLSESYLSSFESGGIKKPKFDTIRAVSFAYQVPFELINNVFAEDPQAKRDKTAHMMNILKQILGDEEISKKLEKINPKKKNAVHNLLGKTINEQMDPNTIKLIIVLYEIIYGKDLFKLYDVDDE